MDNLHNINFTIPKAGIKHWFKKRIRDITCFFQRFNRGWCIKDTWSIRDWFLKVMPDLLMEYKNNLSGCPSNMEISQWEMILQDMYDHLIGCKEDITKNKYYQEWSDMYDKFYKQYGIFGSKLNTDGENIVHFPDEVSDEWAEISSKFLKDGNRLEQERQQHLHLFCMLFEKYFWDLWD
mgnify:CR=1 FL=1